MNKFRNKYRIESNRMPFWDYADNGMYFITFVTEHRSCNLGEIINGEMILSDWGNIVNREWLKSFEMRKELFCDEYIIMPNHLHAIIVLEVAVNDNITDGVLHGHASQQLNTLYSNQPSSIQSSETTVNRSQEFSKLENLNGPDETHGRASHQGRAPHNDHSSQNPSPVRPFRKPKSISSFIAGFKAIINSRIDDYIDDNNLIIPKYNRHNHFFQPNYYDRIIRNEEEYFRIKKYIQDNPANWERDKFYLNKSNNKHIGISNRRQ